MLSEGLVSQAYRALKMIHNHSKKLFLVCASVQKYKTTEKRESYSLSKDRVQSTGYVIVVVINGFLSNRDLNIGVTLRKERDVLVMNVLTDKHSDKHQKQKYPHSTPSFLILNDLSSLLRWKKHHTRCDQSLSHRQ